ncbi:hypothetical protein GGP41_000112 [Bipolaris sorokiniana]|uniref:BTB domain-containing protein n=1 Tax=Cochliobolus sativus TaxID=45130 RepID=A0A8H5ZFU2_COCSA|nr:hypothetical protein GGP41_000112 [Bipolaris sorokiniana]
MTYLQLNDILLVWIVKYLFDTPLLDSDIHCSPFFFCSCTPAVKISSPTTLTIAILPLVADLTLQVGVDSATSTRFLVNRATLIKESVYFKNMLDGAWAEGGQNTIVLKDENPLAVQLFLAATHAAQQFLSQFIQPSECFAFATYVDKIGGVDQVSVIGSAWILGALSHLNPGDLASLLPAA